MKKVGKVLPGLFHFQHTLKSMTQRFSSVVLCAGCSLLLAGAFFHYETLVAQNSPPQVAVAHAPRPERLQPSVDLAQFQDAQRVNYLDISYAVPLPASKNTGRLEEAEMILNLRIYKNDSLWAAKMWKLQEKKNAAAVASRRELVDRLRYMLAAPGQYRAVLHARQAQPPAAADSAEAVLQTRFFSNTAVEVSDVILASEIKKAAAAPAAETGFQSKYEISPNPRHLYGEPVPILYYYFEAYNLISAGIAGGHYKSYWRVEDQDGAPAAGLEQSFRTRKKSVNSSIEMGSINVAALPTGVYTFVYGIADSGHRLQTSRRKKFYVYNPALPPAQHSGIRPAAGMLAHAGVAELDEEFSRMQHILRRDEKKMYESLDNAEAKRKLLLAFWQAHKPGEYAAAEAYRRAYLARAREAEERFATVLRPGWKSEQGRVFILYGPPSNIERVPSNPSTKPYEIWRYDEIQGGVIFVFADRTGFKNYELLHSTCRGELQNPNWESLVRLEAERRQGLQ